jgi:hypothetical protein
MFKIKLPNLPILSKLTNIFGPAAKLEGKLKIIIVALIIFLTISAFLAFSIQSSKTALLNEYRETKTKLMQENEQLFAKLKDALEDNRSLEDRLGLLQRDLEVASSERKKVQRDYELVSAERQELLRIAEEYARLEMETASLEDENTTQREQIAVLKEHNLELETELNGLKKMNKDLKQRIEQTEQVLKRKDATVLYSQRREPEDTEQRFVKGSVDLPTIVVSPQNSTPVALLSSLKGKIVNVNRRYNFVVINLGRNTGIREGMIFEVFRNKNFVGKVEVIQLREKIAACDVIQAYLPLEIDDIVRY